MYASSFDYHRPKTLTEAAALLLRDPDIKVLAGGHSLLPAMKFRLASPKALVDISGLKELQGIQAEGGTLRIGALTTHATLASSDVVRSGCAVLAETAGQIGDVQVRNRGTIGGSLSHADPAADLPTVVTALGGTLTAAGAAGTRDVPAESFFVDLFTTDLRPGELLTAVKVPTYGKGTGAAYLKHRHPASSYAVVGVAAVVQIADGKCARVSLVVGGATPKPTRAPAAEAALQGLAANDASVAAAAAKVADAIKEPIGDTYASGDFRVHLATVLAKRALRAAADQARG
jgi:aerobic carbon-monoxide dehydrogenase medium subunit